MVAPSRRINLAGIIMPRCLADESAGWKVGYTPVYYEIVPVFLSFTIWNHQGMSLRGLPGLGCMWAERELERVS